jgi:hypothetical protein
MYLISVNAVHEQKFALTLEKMLYFLSWDETEQKFHKVSELLQETT